MTPLRKAIDIRSGVINDTTKTLLMPIMANDLTVCVCVALDGTDDNSLVNGLLKAEKVIHAVTLAALNDEV